MVISDSRPLSHSTDPSGEQSVIDYGQGVKRPQFWIVIDVSSIGCHRESLGTPFITEFFWLLFPFIVTCKNWTFGWNIIIWNKSITPKMNNFLDGCLKSEGFEPGIKGSSAGHWVPDASPGCWVSQFHDDKWPFLQGDNTQVLGIIGWFKEWPIAGPSWVPEPQDAILPPAYLGEQTRETLERGGVHNPTSFYNNQNLFSFYGYHLYFYW